MTEMPDNILHLPEYQVLGCKSTDDEMHFQVDAVIFRRRLHQLTGRNARCAGDS